MEPCNYVIIGAGQAGCRAAIALRDADPDGRIILIGAEPHLPYERPALSKGVLTGAVSPQSIIIKKKEQLDKFAIETHLGHSVEQINLGKRKVVLDDGRSFRFDKLMLATGSRVRRLTVSGVELPHIYSLRTVDDCMALSKRLAECRHLVVVGAGFIGLEVAASARQRFGCEVTVVESGAGVLQRGAPDELRTSIYTLHRSKGIKFLFGDVVSAFEGNGIIERVVLTSGKILHTDCVVIGIGVIPETDLAARAGLEVKDGIVVDDFGETSQPGIFAAGEVTNHLNCFLKTTVRIESWQIAQNQSVVAANNMCGLGSSYNEIPWFWTDHFDNNFQLIGDTGSTLKRVTRLYGEVLQSTTFYIDKGIIVGALCINSGKDIRLVREAIRRGINITQEQLADPTIKLKLHLTPHSVQA